jgi:hypothetical protein
LRSGSWINSTNQIATAPERAQLNRETSPAIEGNATTQNIDSGATQAADRVSEPSRAERRQCARCPIRGPITQRDEVLSHIKEPAEYLLWLGSLVSRP